MKNICFLIGNLDHSGGTERVTTLISNQLAKIGYKVYILSLTEGNKPFFELENSIQIGSLYPKKISMKNNFLGVVWKIRKYIKQNQIDTLIVVDSISCIFTIPALYGLKINHICWEHFNFNVNLGVKFRDLGRKLAAKYCNYVVTLTKRDKELWENGLKNIKAKIVPIANPTPYENIKHTPSLESKTILAVGRLTYQKGFDLLISAWAEVCKTNYDWKLQIIGSGEDEEALKLQAESLKIEHRVEFIPATKNIEYYYRNASIYCMSSRFEGFGMVILEALSFGIPVISFDCDAGPSDMIINHKNGYLIENGNIYKLAEKLNYSMNISPSRYMELITDAFQKSRDYYVSNIVNNWLRII